MKTVRRVERSPHSKKNAFVFPNLGKEIVALVQADAMERRQARVHALENVFGQTFSRNRPIFQRRDLVEKTVIQLGSQGMNGRFNFVMSHERRLAGKIFGAKSEARTVVMPVRRCRFAKRLSIFLFAQMRRHGPARS